MHDLTFVPDHNLFVLRFHGLMTVDDGTRAFREMVRHPSFHSAAWVMADTRGVTEAQVDFAGTFASVQGLLGDMAKFGGGSRAVLLVQGETHFGLARMLEQIMAALANLKIRVVATPAEAALHLDLSVERLEALLADAGPLSGGAPQG